MASYKISTLLYCFDPEGRILLLHRNKEPNMGLWSPCGGKLKVDDGESPYDCALRELQEETGIIAEKKDLHLTGIVSECGGKNKNHWLMFLFELKKYVQKLPPNCSEGRFAFFKPSELNEISLPKTDKEYIWPLFWKYRYGFFSVHCLIENNQISSWTVEECWEKRI